MEKAIPIEYILLSNFIKYDEMQRLTLEAFSGSNADTLNIYIDLASMLNSAYQSGVRIENYSIITSTVVNLCSHIRAYYRTRHGVETNIFIVYSINDSPSNKKFYHDYNKSHIARIGSNQKIHDVVISNLKLLNILVPYLPDIYFRFGTFEPSVMIYDIILDQMEKGNTSPNVIFTKDLYSYQIPALIEKDTVIFRKKNDGSYVVDHNNCIGRYFYDSRHKDYQNFNIFEGSLLSLIMSITNLPSRNVYSLLDSGSASRMLKKVIFDDNILINYYTGDMEYVYTILNNIRQLNIDIVNFGNRFKAIDLKYQHTIYRYSPEYSSQYLLNLIDDDAVREINNKYFKTNPLDLDRL